MDDVTDTVFRQIIANCAPPDLYFTEFVNVDGLESPGRERLIHKLEFSNKEKPIIAQIWGLKPENFYKTTKELIKMGFAGVDINMGCPEKTVVKNGTCSALMNNRDLAAEIIKQTQKAAAGKIPVSVKTRLGFNEVDMSWQEFLLNQSLDMLSIHGRTKKQMSKVPSDWVTIGEIRKLRDKISPKTLIVGNGDVLSRDQGLELAKKYKLDGIMIGRGVFQDPYIFVENSPWISQSPSKRIELYKKHIQLFKDTYKHNERSIRTLNKYCKIYINGFDGAKDLRDKLMHADSINQLLELVDRISYEN
jgi:tRNA-dihydrouridine synthase